MPERDDDSRRFGVWLAIASAAAFGTNIVGAQIAGQAGLSGSLLVFDRVIMMLVLIAVVSTLRRTPLAVPRGERGALILFGLATAGVGCAYLSSVAFVPVSVAAVVFYTFPILIVLAEPLVTKARFNPNRLAVALVAFIGVAMVVGPDLHGLDPRGLALAMSASVLAATQFFAGTALLQTPLLPKLLWSHLIILPVSGLILWLTGGFLPPQALAVAPLAVAVTIGGYLVGFLLQLLAFRRIAPGNAGLAYCAEPVFAMLTAALVLGERLGSLQYAGGGLVIVAIAINVILEQKRRVLAPA